MERDKVRNAVVKMVDGLIGEVLAERKSEFDIMRAVVKKKKKAFQNQKKLIVDTTNYSILPPVVKPKVVRTIDVTPKEEYPEEQIIKSKRKKRNKN